MYALVIAVLLSADGGVAPRENPTEALVRLNAKLEQQGPAFEREFNKLNDCQKRAFAEHVSACISGDEQKNKACEAELERRLAKCPTR